MIGAALLLVAAPAAARMPVMPVLTVPELTRRHQALAGRTVRVRGRLAECQPLSCGVLDDERLAAPIAWLSFERAPAFDAAARSAIGRRVIVEGVVTRHCWSGDRLPNGAVQGPCTDRADKFRPARIVRVLDDAEGVALR